MWRAAGLGLIALLWTRVAIAAPALNDFLNTSKAISPQCRAGM